MTSGTSDLYVSHERSLKLFNELPMVNFSYLSYNCEGPPFHSIFHSTVLVHIPVQQLEMPMKYTEKTSWLF